MLPLGVQQKQEYPDGFAPRMDHKFAIKNDIALRYVLGDLSEFERAAYERHYFNCRTCVREIERALELVDEARKVIREEGLLPVAPPRRWWTSMRRLFSRIAGLLRRPDR